MIFLPQSVMGSMRANYKMQRLFVDIPFQKGKTLALSQEHSHYLTRVLRMGKGAELLVFNGHDGEWLAELSEVGKKQVNLCLMEQTRVQPQEPDLVYCFAPLKHARLDYMVQKAVEMGASVLQPVMTQHTQVTRLNEDRIMANVIEAAEQCGILTIPSCHGLQPLQKLLDDWDNGRTLFFCDEAAQVFCDEAAQGNNPLPILAGFKKGPCGVLVGPEGGFSDEERKLLLSKSFVTAIPLGPRILRADTAAVAALAFVSATIGDW